MSNNKQSSVEWLWDKFVNSDLKVSDISKLLEQAKAMHKEEIMECMSDAFEDAVKMRDKNYKSPYDDWEQYYNEKFKGGK